MNKTLSTTMEEKEFSFAVFRWETAAERAARMATYDPLLERQVCMLREGRQALHNMIRGDHGLPNRY